ncbi:MAG: hypothetical protein AABZ92_03515, partial [Verrucomicrobiota bacterium]
EPSNFEPSNFEPSNFEPSNFEPSIEAELNNQFYHIWHRLEKINEIYPSELLQRFISEHQQRIPVQYDESKLQKDLIQDITVQFIQLYHNLQALSKYQLKEDLDESSKAMLDTQFMEVYKCVDEIHNLYQSKRPLSKNDQLFLNHQLEELLVFSQSFLAEGSGTSLNDLENPTEELDNGNLHLTKREAGSTSKPFADEPSPTKIELDNQFNQIWDCLDEMNTAHQSELLQRLISHHKSAETRPYYETLEEVSQENLNNQFIQLHQDLEACSQYQPKEDLDEDSKAKLATQIDRIENHLNTIHEIYNSKKESLSKKEKTFLRDQLEELHNFSYHFITENSLQEENTELSALDKIQMLLNSCEKEDSLIYPQYEYIINSQETNISDLLTSSPTQSNIENHFLYFNEAEGLIELQHTEVHEEHQEPYTTTWRIRPADISLVRDWQENDSITIDETSIFSKYTMYGESLKYTLNNSKKSVRANFVCKSSNQNTYTILSIDYLENIVVLKNGPCLFVQGGDLKEWHVKDSVVLQRSGSVTDTNNSHELINKTRNKKNWVFLKRKW